MKVGINQRVGPIRLCFLILPESEDSFHEAIQAAFSTWGGIFSPILPFYEELPKKYRFEFQIHISTQAFYKNAFENYDVDVVVVDKKINRQLVEKIAEGRTILFIDEFVNESPGTYRNYGIPLEQVAEEVAYTEFKFVRSDNLKFSMPEIEPSELFLKAWRGTLVAKTKEAVSNIFSNGNVLSTVNVNWTNVVEYKNGPNFDFRSLCYYQLSLWRNQRFEQRSLLYCLNSKRLQDVINFWNLRAAGNMVVPLPEDVLDKKTLQALFSEFYEQEIQRQEGRSIIMIDCLVGYGSSGKILRELQAGYHSKNKEAKGGNISFQNWFPRFWSEHEIVMSDRIKSATPYCGSHFEYYDADGERIEFSSLALPFATNGDLNNRSSCKIMMEVLLEDPHAEYAGLLADLSTKQLKKVIKSYSFMDHWRLFAGILHKIVFVNRNKDKIKFSPPKSIDFFTTYFQNKGFNINETPNSKLAKEVFKSMNGLDGVLFFLKKERLQIIELFEERKEVSYLTLQNEIKRLSRNTLNPEFFISRMLENKIVEFGALIQCSVCEQHGYFLPESILPELICPICRNSFSLPMAKPNSITWAYRGIGPYGRSNKAGGVMSVFATLRLFVEHIAEDQKISSLFGFEFVKPKTHASRESMEVDLCLLTGDRNDTFKKPELIFCECKTYAYFKDKDIERMKSLGDAFPGAILTFATLNDQLTPAEITLLTGLVQHFQTGNGQRPRNPVLILTGKELLNDDLIFPLREYDDGMHAYQRYNDYIGSLCEMSISKHLRISNWGDILNDQWNQAIYKKQTIGNIVDAILKSKKE